VFSRGGQSFIDFTRPEFSPHRMVSGILEFLHPFILNSNKPHKIDVRGLKLGIRTRISLRDTSRKHKMEANLALRILETLPLGSIPHFLRDMSVQIFESPYEVERFLVEYLKPAPLYQEEPPSA
ncbi:MAG: hypothetical protein JXB14_08035, partial [Candidatus Altiarchaeota archaeon]|nr:hypothetical protein [Candidatus Altiarchaeota archaeon]